MLGVRWTWRDFGPSALKALPFIIQKPLLYHSYGRCNRSNSDNHLSKFKVVPGNMDRPTKRRKLSPNQAHANRSVHGSTGSGKLPALNSFIGSNDSTTDLATNHDTFDTLVSLNRSITPPPLPRSRSRQESRSQSQAQVIDLTDDTANTGMLPKLIKSPIQLTHIRDLSDSSGNNVDTVKLRDILGDPMIRECWQFNYLHDVDFLMSQFDEDVKNLVTVKVVHGSWKRDAPNRIRIDEACSRYPNVEAIVAYMPEPFGTHHSKMMILLRHDDLAQVVIHTANMIPGDWGNMCQAVWRSPLLPLRESKNTSSTPTTAAIGTGARFKRDLLAYLDAYGNRKTGSLVKQLANYDFDAVRAALIASVPSKQKIDAVDPHKDTLWGWLALKDTLRQVPVDQQVDAAGRPRTPHIVAQISSIATLGQTDKWLKDVFFGSLSPNSQPLTSRSQTKWKYSIIFPTPDEIRRSLYGYGSGGSIHMKLQSAAQQKQLQYMRPYFCQWAGDEIDPGNQQKGNDPYQVKRDAGRRRAAPHIKTYIRFSDTETMDSIDWAMVTSANLSTQAWGAAVNASGEVRISSWEIGVLVWPELFVESQDDDQAVSPAKGQRAVMVPCFKRDLPAFPPPADPPNATVAVGFRMPYDLPLTPYSSDDVPWCATATHTEPDWLGQTWDG